MQSTRRSPYPLAAETWMVGTTRARILDLGSGTGALARSLHQHGHEVFCLDRSPAAVARLAERMDTGRHVAARAEAMPYLSCNFDVVTASQNLHKFAPGLALTEIARVLRPGGHLAIAFNTRDDTVPWVRRLIAIMQRVDPTSMTGDFGLGAVDEVADSPYFGPLDRRNFRNWVPITRAGLITMVERRPSTGQLSAHEQDQLIAEVGDLYDSSARAPDPLLLPYQAACWRAEVDHRGLDLEPENDAVAIRL